MRKFFTLRRCKRNHDIILPKTQNFEEKQSRDEKLAADPPGFTVEEMLLVSKPSMTTKNKGRYYDRYDGILRDRLNKQQEEEQRDSPPPPSPPLSSVQSQAEDDNDRRRRRLKERIRHHLQRPSPNTISSSPSPSISPSSLHDRYHILASTQSFDESNTQYGRSKGKVERFNATISTPKSPPSVPEDRPLAASIPLKRGNSVY